MTNEKDFLAAFCEMMKESKISYLLVTSNGVDGLTAMNSTSIEEARYLLSELEEVLNKEIE